MSKSNSRLHAVVVGRCQRLIADAAETLSRRQIDYVVCPDVYSAVGAFAVNGRQDLLIVGDLEQMGREQGRFFDIIRRRQYLCCAVADSDTQPSATVEALARQSGDLRICDRNSLDRTVASLIADSRTRANLARRPEPHNSGRPGDIRASKAEMEALLGLWVDEKNGQTG